jgi:hypothetical protein
MGRLCYLSPAFKDEAIKPLLVRTFQPYGEIAVMRIDGSELDLLTDNATEEGAPSWVTFANPEVNSPLFEYSLE